MTTKKETADKFALATQLQALVKKQVLGRTPTNVAINAIVKFLPDPQKVDNTASLNAVKANASKKYNKLIETANISILEYQGKVLDAIKDPELEAKITKISIKGVR